MATNFLTTRAISHRERVCSLYKKSLRTIESYLNHRQEYRYRAVLLRARFDENKDILDMRKAVEVVQAGEEKLWEYQHPIPFQYQYSPGGSAYNRNPPTLDWLVDLWHPLEKASYPHYFAQREKRKDEWIAYWEKHYNKGKKYEPHEREWSGNYDETLPGDLPPPSPDVKLYPGFKGRDHY